MTAAVHPKQHPPETGRDFVPSRFSGGSSSRACEGSTFAWIMLLRDPFTWFIPKHVLRA